MTDIEQKALALVNEVRKDCGWQPHLTLSRHDCSRSLALCRAIERHEAFRQEVSDAVEDAVALIENEEPYNAIDLLSRFIIAKPDPLVEALEEASGTNDPVEWANRFYAAIEKRGGKIVWGEG